MLAVEFDYHSSMSLSAVEFCVNPGFPRNRLAFRPADENSFVAAISL
jgi:hypothetical protein